MSHKNTAAKSRKITVKVAKNGQIGAAVLSALIDEHTRRKGRILDLLPAFCLITDRVILATTIAVLRRKDRAYTWDLVFHMCALLNARIEIGCPRRVAITYTVEPDQAEAA